MACSIKLLAETQGIKFDVIATEERTIYTIINMWKVLHGKCPNDVNIQFSVTLRHGQKAVIPTLNRSSSQRNHTTIRLQLLDLDCGT